MKFLFSIVFWCLTFECFSQEFISATFVFDGHKGSIDQNYLNLHQYPIQRLHLKTKSKETGICRFYWTTDRYYYHLTLIDLEPYLEKCYIRNNQVIWCKPVFNLKMILLK